MEISVKGFLDGKSDALDGYATYPPIISSVEGYEIQKDDVFICALGDVDYKKQYANIILNKGGQFISLVHPHASIGINSTIGVGCIIEKNAVLSCDAKLGDFVTMLPSSVLGHDISVGSWTHIGSFAFMGGFSSLGESVTLHPGAHILPHKVVGNHATVCSNSVVMRRVKDNTTVFGNPAKKMEL